MLEHGGALRAAAAQYGIPLGDWLDLSTGIHPHGWSVPSVPATAWQRLPEREDGLEAAAATYYGTRHLLPVAGSQAAIQALPLLRKPGRMGVLHPSYAEHAHAWQRAGHVVETLTVMELETAVDRLDVLVLVHPNNPTGLRFAPEILLRWRERLARRGGWLVVDEAFMDATPNDSLTGHVGLAGLIILRSLGKFFGLAGARVGFVLAEPAVQERLQDALGPWTVSGPARWVAMQALNDRRWQEEMQSKLPHWGTRLAELLKRQRLPVASGTALFQWVPLPEAEFWQEALARRGILVRRFTDPPGLRFGLPGNEPAWRRLEGALTGVRAERLTHSS
ncbi:MAG: threonine-phosphate decarboxylase [Candidatus Competibacteraceae bacterium]|nr:threonine-phosphate decarboxylase [Candidatus Competibacteraceae bacterium]HRY15203.1 threonine-phosphate decarboxylase CobD [Candidatus Competibacteraceae bacterium]